MKRRTVLRAGLGAAAAGLTMRGWAAPGQPIRVLCWAEGTAPTAVYPSDISGAVADALNETKRFTVKTASLNDDDQGLSDAVLAGTDVLFWWGHVRHRRVRDDRVEAILKRVRDGGMGFVALHSAHYSKPFKRLIEDSGDLGGVGINDAPEVVTVKAPDHPIARGIKNFEIPREEFYNEPFGIPTPDVLVFESTWKTGQRFRSGCLWKRGKGQLFYFRPGHETFPVYFQPEVKAILVNAAHWLGQPQVGIQIVEPD